jgi:hypothetical protein
MTLYREILMEGNDFDFELDLESSDHLWFIRLAQGKRD